MKMMSLFNRRVASTSSSLLLRLFSNSIPPSINRSGSLSLLINKGNSYLEIFSSINANGGEEEDVKKLCFPVEGNLLCPLSVSGPCNGVFCVYSSSNWKHVSLLNYATSDIKHIILPRRCEDFPVANIHSLGFGFDSNTNDFKIIRSITYDYWDHAIRSSYLSLRAKEAHCIETFSMNASELREIKVVSEIRSLRPSPCSSAPNVNGVCYWSCKDLYDLKMKVVAFDLADEVFDLFTLPPCDYVNYVLDTEDCLMCTSNGFPAAIRYDTEYADKVFEVWVKREETWVKEMSIGPISHVIKPLCLLNNNAGFILLGSEYQLVLYDFVTKGLGKIDIEIPRPLPIQEEEGIIQVVNLPEKSLDPTIHGNE